MTDNNDKSASGGVLPFDPRQYGPLDCWSDIQSWISHRDRELLGVGALLTAVYGVLWIVYGVSISIPSWIPVFAGSVIAALIIGIYPVRKAIETLWDSEMVPIVVLDAASGDLGVVELSPARFRDLTVVDHGGERHDSSFLREVSLMGGRRAYEVDQYDPERNVAVSSWMSGATNRDIRRHKHTVRYLKEELSREADKSLDALVNAPEVLREQGAVIANSMIRTAEGVESPTDESSDVYDQMWERVEETDRSEELLQDRGMEGDSIEESLGRWAQDKDDISIEDLGLSDDVEIERNGSSETAEGSS